MVVATNAQYLLEEDEYESTIKVVSDDEDSSSSYCKFKKKNNRRHVVEKPQPLTTNKRRRLSSSFKSQLSVRFSTKLDEIQYIPNRNDLSKEEIANCYMTKDETDQIKIDLRNIVKKMITEHLNPHEHSDELRGLEMYATNNNNNDDYYYNISRKQHIQKCRQQIIHHTKYNEYMYGVHGHIDEKWLLYNYRTFTEISVNRARIQGLYDQQLSYYDNIASLPRAPFHQIMER